MDDIPHGVLVSLHVFVQPFTPDGALSGISVDDDKCVNIFKFANRQEAVEKMKLITEMIRNLE